MTTYIPFTPSQSSTPPFQTPVTMDGASYLLTCSWNMYRGGWYYIITSAGGNLIINAALVGSPTGSSVYLAPGIFHTSTLLYRADTGNFEINP